MKKIAIIGLGKRGIKLLNSCLNNPNLHVSYLCVKSEKKKENLETKHQITTYTDYKKIPLDSIDCVVIATPNETHCKISKYFLNKEIPVLIEKPLSTDVLEIEDIIEESTKNKTVAVPFHTFILSEEVKKLENSLSNKKLKNITITQFFNKGDFENIKSCSEELLNRLYHLIYLSISFENHKQINVNTITKESNKIKLNLISKDNQEISINLLDGGSIEKLELNILLQNEKKPLLFEIKTDKIKSDCVINYFADNLNFNTMNEKNLKKLLFDSKTTTVISNQILEKLNKNQKTERKPAYLQITRKCNNNCVFCSNPKIDKDLSLDEILEILKNYKEQDITEVFLTGGEPTIHPLFFEIVKTLNEEGFKVRIITNGMNFGDKTFIDQYEKSNIDSTHLSFHSHVEEQSEKLYGSKETIKLQKEGIKNLNSTNIKYHFNTTINSINYKNLSELMEFIISTCPRVTHIVFNFLDPGKSDGIISNNASKNPWIVPKYSDIENYLYKALELLKKHKKTFRVERVPLCYLRGFEEFSSETRKIVKNENYICSFLRKEKQSEIRKVQDHNKSKERLACANCTFEGICSGIQKEYELIHSDNELYPVFENPEGIIKKIKNEN